MALACALAVLVEHRVNVTPNGSELELRSVRIYCTDVTDHADRWRRHHQHHPRMQELPHELAG
jgi:hypothetical protein